jgi:hypothetical protein
MRLHGFLLFFSIIVLTGASARAQIVNGSFTDGFTGWTTVPAQSPGPGPVIDTANPATLDGSDAEISSLDAGGTHNPMPSGAASAGDIETALGITSLPSADFTFAPSDGQAIYQSFTLTQAADLTFSYSFATQDSTPYDSTGFTINGNYTQIEEPSSPQGPSSYAMGPTVHLGPGTYQLGFVSFNTSDYDGSTTLYVTNVSLALAPEPSTWLLILSSLGLAALLRSATARRHRA